MQSVAPENGRIQSVLVSKKFILVQMRRSGSRYCRESATKDWKASSNRSVFHLQDVSDHEIPFLVNKYDPKRLRDSEPTWKLQRTLTILPGLTGQTVKLPAHLLLSATMQFTKDVGSSDIL